MNKMKRHLSNRKFAIGLSTASAALSALLSAQTHAACSADSGPNQQPVVMLFTSEGCSSCPPADTWLTNAIRSAPSKPVALAFHVAYWDYIGWKDRFASSAYTQLQKRVSAAVGMSTVYTPQVMVQGKEVRAIASWSGDWMQKRTWGEFAQIASKPAAARLTMQMEPVANSQLIASMSLASAVKPEERSQWELMVALTEDRLDSRVTAGENRGEHLRHDAVVRWTTVQDAQATQRVSIPIPNDAKRADLVLNALIVHKKSGVVIQGVTSRSVCPMG
jgi:hypothetical protein